MSRLGKQPVTIPSGVSATFADDVLTITGPKGSLTTAVRPIVAVTLGEGTVAFAPKKETIEARALWGTYASHAHNMIEGVTAGFTRILELEGVGYRAEASGQKLTLSVGYSHPIIMEVPAGISVVVEKSVVTMTGIDKHALGQFAANVRKVRPPEPYKGKGIRYRGEHILRKQGKKAV